MITKKTIPKSLFLLLFSVFLFSTAIGIDIVTFPALLLKNGANPFQIGLSSNAEVLASILTSLFLTKLVEKLGFFKSFTTATLSYCIAILIIFFCKNFYLWLAIVFLMGSCWFIATILRQSWINIIINDNQRGVIAGVYSMMISAGLAFGPVIVKILGAENYFSFLCSSALVLVSLIAINLAKPDSFNLKTGSEKISLKKFFKDNPLCFLGRFFIDAATYCLIIFTVVFAKRIGLSAEKGGLLLSAFMTSGFFDVLVGFLLKKYTPNRLINIGFLGSLGCFSIITLCLTLSLNSFEILLGLYFIFGMFVACAFVSVIALTNQTYQKESLIAANAALQAAGSSGSLVGVFIGGIFIQIFGATGFPISVILICLCYLTFFFIHEKISLKN